jgi:hypothetical protein
MKRLALVVSASFALLMGACDDDGTKKTDARPDSGGDVKLDSGTEGGVPGMCTGTFASLNRTALGAATKPTGMCKASDDLDLICTEDLGGQIRGKYAMTCLTLLPNKTMVVECFNELVKRDYPKLSAGCLGCYTGSVLCTVDNCLGECASNPSAAACTQCQLTKGCLGNFFACSGLPSGSVPLPDAGGGDTPAVDAPADAPADAGVDAAADAPADAASDTGSDI